MNTNCNQGIKISVAECLVAFAHRIGNMGLCAGTGGNISARDGDIIWMKPAGFAMDELTPDNLCSLKRDGTTVACQYPPTSEYRLHLAVYQSRPDVKSVFHTHPPWLTGLISAGVPWQPLTTESVGYLGRVIHLPYVRPQSDALAKQVEDAARDHDTLLLPNHGIVTVGASIREAFHRSLVAEDTAKSIVAARACGTPQFLTDQQIRGLTNEEVYTQSSVYSNNSRSDTHV